MCFTTIQRFSPDIVLKIPLALHFRSPLVGIRCLKNGDVTLASSAKLNTDRQLAALRPDDRARDHNIVGSPGLTLRVYNSGAKQFELRYTGLNGSRRRLLLGVYPDLSLALARKKAAAARVQIVEGRDPAEERQLERQRARTDETLDELAEEYWEAAKVGLHGGRKRPKRAITIENERSIWRNHITKPLGRMRYRELRRAGVKVFVRSLVVDKKLAAGSVASIAGLLQSVLNYAVLEEKLEANPVAGLARPLAMVSRDRMFDDAGLKVIWDAAITAETPLTDEEIRKNVARPEPVTGLAMQLLMLTLTRRNEVAGAMKCEVDLSAGQWTIPTARAKAKHIHVVPLTQEVREVFAKAFALDPASPFVFPSAHVADQHIETRAITRAFARICTRTRMPQRSPHDVRRTGATALTGRYGVSRFIVGLVLGHTPNDGAAVTAVYDRHTYLPEKLAALTAWANHLTGKSVTPMGDQSTVEGAVRTADLTPAKQEAHELVRRGDLHQAVLLLGMKAARRSDASEVHLEILTRAGLDYAGRGDVSELQRWIDGF
ncbi:tyrosine-type recombinase/integrase [Brevundimonas sp. NPDC092305]|uniref:tyrosine-type recombinase/integrase n=1 Tax=Brevundimonas sp. NPDC092305 TaxID=3363957 RepID=UPI003811ED30